MQSPESRTISHQKSATPGPAMQKGLEASQNTSFSQGVQRSSPAGLTSDQRNIQTPDACLTMQRREENRKGEKEQPHICQTQLLLKTSVPVLIHHLDMFPNSNTPSFSLEI